MQLRAQQGFLLANDINFDGVKISRDELRELVRMSKSFKDMAQNEFVLDQPLSEAEQARRKAAFEAQVKSLLGPKRFADYQRAQDFNFRETLAFTRQNQAAPRPPQSVFTRPAAMRKNRPLKFRMMGRFPRRNAPQPWPS